MPPSVDGEDTEILAHSAFALQRIAGSALAAHGYQIFSRSRDAGADIFAKEAGAPPPMLYGHAYVYNLGLVDSQAFVI